MDPLSAMGTASAVLDLGKVAWKLGSALVKLYQDTKCVDDTVEKLANEVKSLGNECDLVHAELEDILKRGNEEEISEYDLDNRLWECLSNKVGECNETIEALRDLVNEVSEKAPGFVGQVQRQMRLNKNRSNFQRFEAKLRTHTDGLHTTLMVINIKIAHITPGNVSRELGSKLDTLQDLVEKLQQSITGNMKEVTSDTDTILLQCARDVITEGSTIYEGSLAAPSTNIRVAQWVGAVDRFHRDAWISESSDAGFTELPILSRDNGHTIASNTTSLQHEFAGDHGFDDDIDIDLAKAVLKASETAFEASRWQEADSLLQETIQLLQQLPKARRKFCDIFDLQHKRAVCAYHTQQPSDAVRILKDLLQHVPISDTQRRGMYEVEHYLSLLYVDMNQLDDAKASCEKVLKARWRLFGRNDDATLESIALMARINQLLHNDARARAYLAMIPMTQRTSVTDSIDPSTSTTDDPPSTVLAESKPQTPEQSLDQLNLTQCTSNDSCAVDLESTFSATLSLLTPETSASSAERDITNDLDHKVLKGQVTHDSSGQIEHEDKLMTQDSDGATLIMTRKRPVGHTRSKILRNLGFISRST